MPPLKLIGLLAAGGLLCIYDILYRWLVIRPGTNISGQYAAFIEERHIYRWLAPVVAGLLGVYDVFFVGNSHVMDGIDPAVVHRLTGKRAFNVGLYSLAPQNALELVLRYKHYPRLILMDISTRYSLYRSLPHVGLAADKALEAGRVQQAFYFVSDRLYWLLPWMFIPRPFWRSILRIPAKLYKLIRSGRMDFGRYAPFRPFVSYDWWLSKDTNHRSARRVRPQSSREREAERYYRQKGIAEMEAYCDPSNEDFQKGWLATEHMLRTLIASQVQIVLMRMPLHPELVAYEDQHFQPFFDDIKQLANRLGAEYLDLTAAPARQALGDLEFYSDGEHLIESSCQRLSTYLSGIVAARLDGVGGNGLQSIDPIDQERLVREGSVDGAN